MIELKTVNAVLVDKNGLPCASLLGDLDFCVKSFVKTIKDATNLTDDVKALVSDGDIVITSCYSSCIDDNNPALNRCVGSQNFDGKTISFKVRDCQIIFDDYKKFTRLNVKALSLLSKQFIKLKKESIVLYEYGKNSKQVNCGRD